MLIAFSNSWCCFIFAKSGNLSFVLWIAWDLEEASLWSVFLPCSDARETQVWSTRLEHSLRVQWIGSQDQHEATAGKISHKNCLNSQLCLIISHWCSLWMSALKRDDIIYYFNHSKKKWRRNIQTDKWQVYCLKHLFWKYQSDELFHMRSSHFLQGKRIAEFKLLVTFHQYLTLGRKLPQMK